MGVNIPAFSADSASFASVSVGTMFVTILADGRQRYSASRPSPLGLHQKDGREFTRGKRRTAGGGRRTERTRRTGSLLTDQPRYPTPDVLHSRLQVRICIRPQVHEPAVILYRLLAVSAFFVQLAQPSKSGREVTPVLDQLKDQLRLQVQFVVRLGGFCVARLVVRLR